MEGPSEKKAPPARRTTSKLSAGAKVSLALLLAACLLLLTLLLLTGMQLGESKQQLSDARVRLLGALQSELNQLYRSYEKLSIKKFDAKREVMPELHRYLYGAKVLNSGMGASFGERPLSNATLQAAFQLLDSIDNLLDDKKDISKAATQLGMYVNDLLTSADAAWPQGAK
ncbi:MAG: hypothetical protein ACOYI8_02320 [Christensenellales bacterium]|jgi:hypothetical protein